MLKGISPLLTPELLKILAEMGHGDELVIGDCNFPAQSMGKRCVRCDGKGGAELLDAILTVGKCNIVGADVNELAPMLDASGASTAAACKVVREMLLAIHE